MNLTDRIKYSILEFHPLLYVKSLFVKKNEGKIPLGFYCYDSTSCEYLSTHKRFGDTFNWCSYCRRSDCMLLDDECKICGVDEEW